MTPLRLLAWSKGVQITVTSIVLAFGAVAGVQLTGVVWGTVPQTIVLATAGVATVPISLLMRRFGRASVFGVGAAFGTVGALLSMMAVIAGSFFLLCAGSFAFGIYQSTAQYHRFAAAEAVPVNEKGRAIAHIMAAGCIAALVGPWIGSHAQPLFAPFVIAGPFAAIALMLLLNMIGFAFWRSAPIALASLGRSTSAIIRDRGFIQAATLGACCQAVMSYVMTATPLAVVGCGLTTSDAAIVVQWHLLAMYAPSYVLKYTALGRSPAATVWLGCGAFLLSLVVLLDATMTSFVAGLILLGVGWNFTHVGATTLLVTSLPAEDQSRAQGANEQIIWATSAASAILSGLSYALLGWQMMLMMAMLPLGMVIIMVIGKRLNIR